MKSECFVPPAGISMLAELHSLAMGLSFQELGHSDIFIFNQLCRISCGCRTVRYAWFTGHLLLSSLLPPILPWKIIKRNLSFHGMFSALCTSKEWVCSWFVFFSISKQVIMYVHLFLKQSSLQGQHNIISSVRFYAAFFFPKRR